MGVAARGRLADAVAYDRLQPGEQALVRTAWEDGMQARIAGLSLRDELFEEGRDYVVVADAAGKA